eukprot:scaffold4868_cov416-Prasinococcus_capsulatus_cf.AAC.34
MVWVFVDCSSLRHGPSQAAALAARALRSRQQQPHGQSRSPPRSSPRAPTPIAGSPRGGCRRCDGGETGPPPQRAAGLGGRRRLEGEDARACAGAHREDGLLDSCMRCQHARQHCTMYGRGTHKSFGHKCSSTEGGPRCKPWSWASSHLRARSQWALLGRGNLASGSWLKGLGVADCNYPLA